MKAVRFFGVAVTFFALGMMVANWEDDGGYGWSLWCAVAICFAPFMACKEAEAVKNRQ